MNFQKYEAHFSEVYIMLLFSPEYEYFNIIQTFVKHHIRLKL